ncbi:G5 domain-containing protein [Streptococcus merionis]|uniref:G5 domain-containing protein n=1 Tax=Streptococcus merionis TaxID=400065 RepID=UPI0026F20DDF|nr:G5 domain-containing protein [Streptococcus merionis]
MKDDFQMDDLYFLAALANSRYSYVRVKAVVPTLDAIPKHKKPSAPKEEDPKKDQPEKPQKEKEETPPKTPEVPKDTPQENPPAPKDEPKAETPDSDDSSKDKEDSAPLVPEPPKEDGESTPKQEIPEDKPEQDESPEPNDSPEDKGEETPAPQEPDNTPEDEGIIPELPQTDETPESPEVPKENEQPAPENNPESPEMDQPELPTPPQNDQPKENGNTAPMIPESPKDNGESTPKQDEQAPEDKPEQDDSQEPKAEAPAPNDSPDKGEEAPQEPDNTQPKEEEIPQQPKVEHIVEAEVLPFKTIRRANPELFEGLENVVTKGQNGTAFVTYKITKVNGVTTKKEKISTQVQTPAVDQVVEYGAKKRPVIVKSEVKETQVILHGTKKIENANLEKGKTRTLVAGQNGEKVITYAVVTVDGVETKREKINELITKPAVDTVIEVGTKETTQTPAPMPKTPEMDSDTKAKPDMKPENAPADTGLGNKIPDQSAKTSSASSDKLTGSNTQPMADQKEGKELPRTNEATSLLSLLGSFLLTGNLLTIKSKRRKD